MVAKKLCDENRKKENKKQQALHTRLLEESEGGKPLLKEEKEDCFVTRDIESLFIKGTNNII